MWDNFSNITASDRERFATHFDALQKAVNKSDGEISQAWSPYEPETIRNSIHSLLPILQLMGLTPLWELASEVEKAISKTETPSKIIELTQDFLTKLHFTLNAIQKEVESK